ncbi:tachykinins [Eurytemora carolleeae]|uniref:tachykinins n=1 Tax=Eurytemora carolleeae TaxID=1294199 RepID=UPI000C7585A9|nr:tachykinins [Eurytemora carolleeae]|eukprot:XP_023322859.1 tachykinins-like [Eurytemora affinis]
MSSGLVVVVLLGLCVGVLSLEQEDFNQHMDYSLNRMDPLERRAGFVGMRGRRTPDIDLMVKRPSFTGMRGKKAPFNGMRGKKSISNISNGLKFKGAESPGSVWKRFLNYQRRNPSGFVGMRG